MLQQMWKKCDNKIQNFINILEDTSIDYSFMNERISAQDEKPLREQTIELSNCFREKMAVLKMSYEKRLELRGVNIVYEYKTILKEYKKQKILKNEIDELVVKILRNLEKIAASICLT